MIQMINILHQAQFDHENYIKNRLPERWQHENVSVFALYETHQKLGGGGKKTIKPNNGIVTTQQTYTDKWILRES